MSANAAHVDAEQAQDERIISRVVDIFAEEYRAVFNDTPGVWPGCIKPIPQPELAQLATVMSELSEGIKRSACPAQLIKLQTTVDHLSELIKGLIKAEPVPNDIPEQLCEIRGAIRVLAEEMKTFTAALKPSLARKRLRVALQRAEMADLRSVCREISDARSEICYTRS